MNRFYWKHVPHGCVSAGAFLHAEGKLVKINEIVARWKPGGSLSRANGGDFIVGKQL